MKKIINLWFINQNEISNDALCCFKLKTTFLRFNYGLANCSFEPSSNTEFLVGYLTSIMQFWQSQHQTAGFCDFCSEHFAWDEVYRVKMKLMNNLVMFSLNECFYLKYVNKQEPHVSWSNVHIRKFDRPSQSRHVK